MDSRRLAALLALALCAPLQARAAALSAQPSSPDASAPELSPRERDERAVRRALESWPVQRRLHELGLTDDDLRFRLDRLSDAQLRDLAREAQKVEGAELDFQSAAAAPGAVVGR